MTAYVLNLFDLFFTLYAISHGGIELNPMMRNIPIMITYKVFVVGVLCWWLSKRKEKIARFGLYAITIFYAILIGWHIISTLEVHHEIHEGHELWR